MSSGPPPDRPNAAWDPADPDNGGGFVNFHHDDPDRDELEAQHAARIRARFGDEALERIERSRALGRSPRPLNQDEVAVLRTAVAPLLRDMQAAGQAWPDIREEAHDDRGEDAVCAWIQEPECPDHPGTHILRPDTRDEVAVWCCPQSGNVIARIGQLT